MTEVYYDVYKDEELYLKGVTIDEFRSFTGYGTEIVYLTATLGAKLVIDKKHTYTFKISDVGKYVPLRYGDPLLEKWDGVCKIAQMIKAGKAKIVNKQGRAYTVRRKQHV